MFVFLYVVLRNREITYGLLRDTRIKIILIFIKEQNAEITRTIIDRCTECLHIYYIFINQKSISVIFTTLLNANFDYCDSWDLFLSFNALCSNLHETWAHCFVIRSNVNYNLYCLSFACDLLLYSEICGLSFYKCLILGYSMKRIRN